MFLAYGIDGINFFGGPKAFLELVDVQLTHLKQVDHDFWKMPKTILSLVGTPNIVGDSE